MDPQGLVEKTYSELPTRALDGSIMEPKKIALRNNFAPPNQ